MWVIERRMERVFRFGEVETETLYATLAVGRLDWTDNIELALQLNRREDAWAVSKNLQTNWGGSAQLVEYANDEVGRV